MNSGLKEDKGPKKIKCSTKTCLQLAAVHVSENAKKTHPNRLAPELKPPTFS